LPGTSRNLQRLKQSWVFHPLWFGLLTTRHV
jgi:hypothetical protein